MSNTKRKDRIDRLSIRLSKDGNFDKFSRWFDLDNEIETLRHIVWSGDGISAVESFHGSYWLTRIKSCMTDLSVNATSQEEFEVAWNNLKNILKDENEIAKAGKGMTAVRAAWGIHYIQKVQKIMDAIEKSYEEELQ